MSIFTILIDARRYDILSKVLKFQYIDKISVSDKDELNSIETNSDSGPEDKVPEQVTLHDESTICPTTTIARKSNLDKSKLKR